MKVYSFPTIHCTIFSQGQHQLVSCSSCECTYTHTRTQKNSSFASFNKANIILYFVWTGSYQAILLWSVIFLYKIYLGDEYKLLCFLLDYGFKYISYTPATDVFLKMKSLKTICNKYFDFHFVDMLNTFTLKFVNWKCKAVTREQVFCFFFAL